LDSQSSSCSLSFTLTIVTPAERKVLCIASAEKLCMCSGGYAGISTTISALQLSL
jgi:hypothetical protein